MNNFFFVHDPYVNQSYEKDPAHCEDTEFSRDFKQGVSFRCRPFEFGVEYHNDNFVQDFVIYNGTVYMCVVESTTNSPEVSED